MFSRGDDDPRRPNRAREDNGLKQEKQCWDLGRINSPTSARRGDGLEYIRIWVTPAKKASLLG